jgi:hypothetical protein
MNDAVELAVIAPAKDAVLAVVRTPNDVAPVTETVLPNATAPEVVCDPRTTMSLHQNVPILDTFEYPAIPLRIHGVLMFDCAEVFWLR